MKYKIVKNPNYKTMITEKWDVYVIYDNDITTSQKIQSFRTRELARDYIRDLTPKPIKSYKNNEPLPSLED